MEEERLRRKQERREQREIMMGRHRQGRGDYKLNRDAVEHLRRANAAAHATGGNEVMLAYGLNKNLKQLKNRSKSTANNRARSAKIRSSQQPQYQEHYIPSNAHGYQQQYQSDQVEEEGEEEEEAEMEDDALEM